MKHYTVNFERLVRDSINKVSIMTSRSFSRKARGYMLGYRHKELEKEGVDEKPDTKGNSSYEYNKKTHNMYRLHRDTNCIDGAFIERVVLHCTSIAIE